jgi:hypothetical protein
MENRTLEMLSSLLPFEAAQGAKWREGGVWVGGGKKKRAAGEPEVEGGKQAA